MRQVTAVKTAAVSSIDEAVARGVTSIADGGTDTVTGLVATVPTAITYKITNAGTELLTRGDITLGTPTNCTVTIATDWTVVQPTVDAAGSAGTLTTSGDMPGNVPVAGYATFAVTITPAVAGAWSCTISVPNNTAAKNPYNWTMSGTAAAYAAEIAVTRSSTPVADGDTDSAAGTVHAVATVLTYVIANSGTAPLTLSAVTLGSLTNCTATATTDPTAPVATSGSTNMVIEVTPAAAGAWSFTVSKPNNDADENPYNWTVSGTAT
jgi:hypothetical protein